MDPKLVYWTAAQLNMGAVVLCALLGVRRARERAFEAHKRLMLVSAGLVLLFLVSYVFKVSFLGREQLERWEPLYRNVLHFHETCVLAMVVCGALALVQARRLGLPRGPESPEIGWEELVRGLRWHRGLGRAGVLASLLGFASAAIVLWGMYARAGLP
jgi:uncharacterized membrane protein YozB (DUF420 family)